MYELLQIPYPEQSIQQRFSLQVVTFLRSIPKNSRKCTCAARIPSTAAMCCKFCDFKRLQYPASNVASVLRIGDGVDKREFAMTIKFPIIMGIMLLATAVQAAAAPIPTVPVYTNKTRFRIPYRYEPEEMRRLGAREIQLFASFDHGANWQSIQSVSPQDGRFDFQATSDGEYWFAVRTVDVNGRLHPEGAINEPGLKVTVDTDAPLVELNMSQLSAGKVQLFWQTSDPNLDPTSLLLEFIQPGATQWQPVAVVPEQSGETTWSVPDGGIVAVRGSIKDLAGNVGQSQSQIRIDAVRDNRPANSVPDFSQPIANDQLTPHPTLSMDEQFPMAASQSNADPFVYQPVPSPLPEINAQSVQAQPFKETPAPIEHFVVDSTDKRPLITSGRYGSGNDGNANSSISDSRSGAAAPWQTGQFRTVNSKKFQIGYKIDSVGPSGVGRVELFITENGGQKWWKYGEDADQKSPFSVEVPRDGVYGFIIRVQSGVGLAEEPPQHGQKPSVVIVVDQTPPAAELTGLEQGQGADLHKILIRWRVSDEHPSDTPVAFSYSSSPRGPWEPISGWLQDTGSYAWSVGAGVPSHVFVRMTARDAAGNIVRVDSPQPVVVDLAKPTATIVDVESIEERSVQ